MPNTIKNLPNCDKPREKLLHCGAASLSDSELLAVLLSSGTKNKSSLDVANDIIKQNENYDGLVWLLHCDLTEYENFEGIGPVKAMQLSCVSEIAKRIWKRTTRSNSRQFTKASHIADYFMQDFKGIFHEEVHIVCFDVAMQITFSKCICKGTMDASIISIREVLQEVLKHKCMGFVLIHNHPSGNANPSKDDVKVTLRLARSAKLVELNFLDHIIIGDNKYFSFKENKLI
jgi:DNA repair protein RadC